MASSTSPPTAQSDITKWASQDGVFRRRPSSFRDSIKAGGRFPPEAGRYYLYVSYACPWAHRTLIVRHLKGLAPIIPVAVVHPFLDQNGWAWPRTIPEEFDPSMAGVVEDPLYGSGTLRELYFKADEGYQGRFTVPVLWDSKDQTIVNNESSEIIRMFNHEFDSLLSDPSLKSLHLYPANLQQDIDALNEWVYDTVNNGVYKAGFATKQAAYEAAVKPLFASLDRLEKMLGGGKKWLVGDALTEADVRLFTTLIRFDPVYVGHFKCNIGTIRGGYPNLHQWLRNLYWNYPAFQETTNFQHIKNHYYQSHAQINPTRVVPLGPQPNILPLDA
jgi:putative glutathione S-transferase